MTTGVIAIALLVVALTFGPDLVGALAGPEVGGALSGPAILVAALVFAVWAPPPFFHWRGEWRRAAARKPPRPVREGEALA
jgi:hypothetical protein